MAERLFDRRGFLDLAARAGGVAAILSAARVLSPLLESNLKTAEAQTAFSPADAANSFGGSEYSSNPDNWRIHPLGEGVIAAELKANPTGNNALVNTQGGLVEGFVTVGQAEVLSPVWSRDVRAVTLLADGRRIGQVPLAGGTVFFGGVLDSSAFTDARRQDHYKEFRAREVQEQAGITVLSLGFATDCPPTAGVPLKQTPDEAAAFYGGDAYTRDPANWELTALQFVDRGPVVALRIRERADGAHIRLNNLYGITVDGWMEPKGLGPVVLAVDGTVTQRLDLRGGTLWNTQDQGWPTNRDLAVGRLAKDIRTRELAAQVGALQLQVGFFQEADFNAVACPVDP